MLKLLNNTRADKKGNRHGNSEEQIEMTLQGKKALLFNDRINKIIETATITLSMICLMNWGNDMNYMTMNLWISGSIHRAKTFDLERLNRIGYTDIPESQIANAKDMRWLEKPWEEGEDDGGSKENKPCFDLRNEKLREAYGIIISKRSAKQYLSDAVLAYENNTQINKQCIKRL